jgi:hypothetical protein
MADRKKDRHKNKNTYNNILVALQSFTSGSPTDTASKTNSRVAGTNRSTKIHTDRKTERQTDRKTDRKTDIKTANRNTYNNILVASQSFASGSPTDTASKTISRVAGTNRSTKSQDKQNKEAKKLDRIWQTDIYMNIQRGKEKDRQRKRQTSLKN